MNRGGSTGVSHGEFSQNAARRIRPLEKRDTLLQFIAISRDSSCAECSRKLPGSLQQHFALYRFITCTPFTFRRLNFSDLFPVSRASPPFYPPPLPSSPWKNKPTETRSFIAYREWTSARAGRNDIAKFSMRRRTILPDTYIYKNKWLNDHAASASRWAAYLIYLRRRGRWEGRWRARFASRTVKSDLP